MKAYISSKPLLKPHIYITAYNAIESHQNNANFKCDGTDDDLILTEGIELISEIGGVIELSEGQFNFTDEVVVSCDGISIIGSGMGATTVYQATANKAAFNFGASDYARLTDVNIKMPVANSGDGVIVGAAGTQSTGTVLKRLRFTRGSPTGYAIRMNNPFEFNIEDIKYNKVNGFFMNGIMIENLDNDVNYGNARVSNVSLSMIADTVGLYVKGAALHNMNIMTFDTINIASSIPNGQTGIKLENAHYCHFTGCDLENLETAILFNNANYHEFTGTYFGGNTNKLSGLNTATYIKFFGGTNPGTLSGTGNTWY